MAVNLDKYKDILCPFCRSAGKEGRMRAKVIISHLGEDVAYVCMEGCVIMLRLEQVKDELKLQNQKLFA